MSFVGEKRPRNLIPVFLLNSWNFESEAQVVMKAIAMRVIKTKFVMMCPVFFKQLIINNKLELLHL